MKKPVLPRDGNVGLAYPDGNDAHDPFDGNIGDEVGFALGDDIGAAARLEGANDIL